MTSDFAAKPPAFFWAVSGLFLLWTLMGCVALYLHVAYGPTLDPSCTEWDKAYYAALPGWFVWDFGVATVGALLGSIALLIRSAHARTLYIVSLIAAAIEFGWMFTATDIIAHKGFLAAAGFPIFILVMGVVQLWFADLAAKRGWIS